jgi:hypothetical protein
MTDPTITSNIADEDQFHDALIAEKGRQNREKNENRYAEFESKIHELLARQDSDNTLTLVTK